jgi:hypothetical protein
MGIPKGASIPFGLFVRQLNRVQMNLGVAQQFFQGVEFIGF